MLALSNISKSFNGIPALHDIDLQIEASQTTVLIGPSGCGKSTLLRIMIGLIRPENGTVRFEEKEVNPTTARDLRKKMGYVIQDGGLFPHLTARKNISIMAEFLEWPADRVDGRIDELIDLTQFPAGGLQRFPAELSGGQQQRVSLMRALMLDPDLLLMDEPLGALDPMIRFELQTELKAIFQKLRKTVAMVTHDMGEAGFFGDTIVLMREGRIVQQADLQTLVRNPADEFVTKFINAQRSPLETIGETQA